MTSKKKMYNEVTTRKSGRLPKGENEMKMMKKWLTFVADRRIAHLIDDCLRIG